MQLASQGLPTGDVVRLPLVVRGSCLLPTGGHNPYLSLAMADDSARLKAALAECYAVEKELGRGGMATVYLAEDLKHNRKVAVKVFRSDLAAVLGSERFLQEVRVTANLQHPHILPLFDSGGAEGFLYYVMPYVEGESLQDRLQREKQLPVAEALQITREAASALDYAHRRGVIHRDIKPGNILLQEGQALVADFGIALALSVAGGDRITESGISLGTPAYMSPEQATGDSAIDGRSDIYSLAAVLFEMLTGEPPHTGATAQAIIAKVITDHPRPVRQLRDTTPVHVEQALEKGLAKLPADRFASPREFSDALSGRRTSDPGPPRWIAPTRSWSTRALGWTGVAVLAGIGLGMGVGRSLSSSPPTAPVPTIRFVIDVPADAPIAPSDLSPVAISSDGRWLAYVGLRPQGSQIFLRDLQEDFVASPIPGTEGAMGPSFSPDGEWVAFFADGKLKKVARGGGAPVSLADAVLARGAYWGRNETILFTAAPGTGLWRVSANGGTPEIVTNLDADLGERTHRFPHITPDGRFAFFTIRTGHESTFDAATIALLVLESGTHRVILVGGSQPKLSPSGHLVFARGGSLYATRVDLEKLEITGQPAPVIENVMTDPSTGAAHFSLSGNGTLVYVAGGPWSARRQMRLLAPGGPGEVLSSDSRPFRSPRFSPDGGQLAVVTEAANDDIWIYDLRAGTSRRLTFESGSNIAPLWTRDGTRIVFSSNRAGRYNLYWKPADGSGAVDRLTTSDRIQFASSWHPDGHHLAFTQNDPETAGDIWVVAVGSNEDPTVFVQTPFNEYGAAFSIDGEWLAYVSDESGRDEVYVQRYPGGEGKQQVSQNGGTHPAWAPDGRRLFYRMGPDLMSANFTSTPNFAAGNPSRLVSLPFNDATVASVSNYDVSPDGSGFVVLRTEDQRPPTQIHVIVNWIHSLDQRLEPMGN
jgi:serine/threonine protein kinase/Tol biopolymer transport system component